MTVEDGVVETERGKLLLFGLCKICS